VLPSLMLFISDHQIDVFLLLKKVISLTKDIQGINIILTIKRGARNGEIYVNYLALSHISALACVGEVDRCSDSDTVSALVTDTAKK